MKLIPLQIIAIAFALFALSRVFRRFKNGKITSKEFALWSIIWIGVIAVSLSMKIVTVVTEFLGVQRPVDALTFVSIILLFYLVYRIYVRFEKVEHDITLVVRDLSFRKKKKK